MSGNSTPSVSNDEVDLRLLICKLWVQRKIILAITSILTLCALGYTIIAPSVYQVQVQILPPTRSDLAAYNVVSRITKDSGSDIEEITPERAYKVFAERLKSDTVKEDFFERFYKPAMRSDGRNKEEILKAMSKNLKIILPREGNQEISMAMKGTDPKRLTEWANSYVDLAMNAATHQLIKDLNREVETRLNGVNTQIEAYRKVAKEGRENQILRVKDAVNIAKNIGLESPAEIGAIISVEQQKKTSSLDGPVSSGLLYMQGYKALESQLRQLEQRVNDDPYIPELPDLQKRHALLTRIDVKPDSFSAARIDGPAVTPEEPVEPNKALIVALGVACGIMLSVIVALIMPERKRSSKQ